MSIQSMFSPQAMIEQTAPAPAPAPAPEPKKRIVRQEDKALLEEIAKLKTENERLKQAKPVRPLWLKVSEKGAISLYGVHGKFPVTLYANQWAKLITYLQTGELEKFAIANEKDLKVKE